MSTSAQHNTQHSRNHSKTHPYKTLSHEETSDLVKRLITHKSGLTLFQALRVIKAEEPAILKAAGLPDTKEQRKKFEDGAEEALGKFIDRVRRRGFAL